MPSYFCCWLGKTGDRSPEVLTPYYPFALTLVLRFRSKRSAAGAGADVGMTHRRKTVQAIRECRLDGGGQQIDAGDAAGVVYYDIKERVERRRNDVGGVQPEWLLSP